MYRVQIRKKAKKELDNIPQERRNRILASLVYLTTDPFIGEPLKGEYQGHYSLFLRPYRIIYQICEQQLFILAIRVCHHKDA
ncbi:MAG: type II toxin-antitoxin system mRNA interferase toxin, RelE/StbE family [Candidatus Pacebacteria bacterium]|nr:type II toxin-antitoxin system mRNA interferase toxin, RelE/StbE family [Candidatus Paceibacterota bacterium]